MVSLRVDIKKKDLWLLSAIIVFMVGVGFVMAWTYPGETAVPSIHGHTSDEINGSLGGFDPSDMTTTGWVTDSQASITFPNGLIMKWGNSTTTNSGVVVTFQTPFPNEILTAQVSGAVDLGDTYNPPTVWDLSKNNLTVESYESFPVRWFAIGY